MAYDKGLAHRLEEYFEGRSEVESKKMFGGLCFMVNRHMCCGIVGDTLMARVGPDQYEECLSHQHSREMDFTGRAMKGLVYVAPEGITADKDLKYWIQLCERFVESLPPK
ncbi:MAG: TfoX/Sxy family protein [Balneolaceae bacterium]|nr:TfoX/Sxy family protein [Balneolaceae bacterium]